MNHDTKVGLGLGILLAGIATAFYFREQPTSQDSLPEIQSVEALDREISESLSVVDRQSTPFQDFEHQLTPDRKLELGEIDLSNDLPVTTDSPDRSAPETDPVQIESNKISVGNISTPTFDSEFEFLNDPEQSDSVVATPEPLTTEDSTERIPARALVQSESRPPRELPRSVEMFSEDLPSPQLNDESIPLQLDPIMIDSPTVAKPEIEKEIEIESNEVQSVPEKQHAEPVRDPRIIVPKRVRLNEPIARRTIEEYHETHKDTESQKTPKSPGQSRGASTASPSNGELPSLEGLEPIDPNR